MHVNTNNKIKPQFLFALKNYLNQPPPPLQKNDMGCLPWNLQF